MHFITIILLALIVNGYASPKASASDSKEFSMKIYGNWCGPNHPIRSSASPSVIDYVDNACKQHDLCYEKNGYFNCECDMELLGTISTIEQHVRRSRATPKSSLYGPESLASAATQLYYSLPVCTGSGFFEKAAVAPFTAYRTGAGIVGGIAAEIITLPLKGLWWAMCPFSQQGCENPP